MIYLTRHGETIWNRAGRWQGHKDSPLTARGVFQAEIVGRQLLRELKDRSAVRIISSPLGRATTTAEIIARCLGIDPGQIVAEPLLSEHNMGHWQGLTNAQIDARYPGARKERQENKWNYVIPGGESYAQIYERAVAWLATIPEERIVVAVAHGMIGRTIRGAYCQLDPDSMLAFPHHHNRIYRLYGGKIEEIVCD